MQITGATRGTVQMNVSRRVAPHPPSMAVRTAFHFSTLGLADISLTSFLPVSSTIGTVY